MLVLGPLYGLAVSEAALEQVKRDLDLAIEAANSDARERDTARIDIVRERTQRCEGDREVAVCEAVNCALTSRKFGAMPGLCFVQIRPNPCSTPQIRGLVRPPTRCGPDLAREYHHVRRLVLGSRRRRTGRASPGSAQQHRLRLPQQQQDDDELVEGWSPGFIDYLFLAFNTATAFSPTDTLVLSRRMKLLMMVQSLISLLVVAVLAARAINTTTTPGP